MNENVTKLSCEHGRLRRSCEQCAVEKERDELRSALDAANKENARLREALTNASSLARAAEPVNGWGTRTVINDAWADGFRTACVEISDALFVKPKGAT